MEDENNKDSSSNFNLRPRLTKRKYDERSSSSSGERDVYVALTEKFDAFENVMEINIKKSKSGEASSDSASVSVGDDENNQTIAAISLDVANSPHNNPIDDNEIQNSSISSSDDSNVVDENIDKSAEDKTKITEYKAEMKRIDLKLAAQKKKIDLEFAHAASLADQKKKIDDLEFALAAEKKKIDDLEFALAAEKKKIDMDLKANLEKVEIKKKIKIIKSNSKDRSQSKNKTI